MLSHIFYSKFNLTHLGSDPLIILDGSVNFAEMCKEKVCEIKMS